MRQQQMNFVINLSLKLMHRGITQPLHLVKNFSFFVETYRRFRLDLFHRRLTDGESEVDGNVIQ